MSTTYSVGYIVGSISSVSINRRLAFALEKLAPEAGLVLHEIPIAELPFYNHDYEAPDADYPGAAAEYRDAVSRADGILIITPEYNRSIPGVLKNALDWVSRPKGQRLGFDHTDRGRPRPKITHAGSVRLGGAHVRGVDQPSVCDQFLGGGTLGAPLEEAVRFVGPREQDGKAVPARATEEQHHARGIRLILPLHADQAAPPGSTDRSSDPHVPQDVIIKQQDPLSQQTLTVRDLADALTFDVTDEGEVRRPAARLFDRGHNDGKGTGIGLALALAVSLGGRLSLTGTAPTASTLLVPSAGRHPRRPRRRAGEGRQAPPHPRAAFSRSPQR
ncbi:NAD(P)H-dependent oxidoreductase [Streptomyces puniciscabiei]